MHEKAQLIQIKEIKTPSQYKVFKERQLQRGSRIVEREYSDFQNLTYFLFRQKEAVDTWRLSVIKEIESDLINKGKMDGVLYVRKTVREWKGTNTDIK